MAIEQYSTGLPQNHTKRFDALTYKTAYAVEEWDSNFTDDNCIVVYNQAKTPMMDTGTIPKGELAGFYVLKTFWTSNNLGQADLEVLIYEDGVVADTLTAFWGGDFLNTGSVYNVFFSPLHEYRIVVQTGSDGGLSKVKLDYIQIESIPRNAVIGARTDNSSGDGTPYLEVTDRGTITNTYTGAAASTGSITFNVTFTTPPQIFTQSRNQDHTAAPTVKSTTGATVYSRNMDGSVYTGSVNIDWVAYGSVKAPFKGVNYDI